MDVKMRRLQTNVGHLQTILVNVEGLVLPLDKQSCI